MAGTPTQYYGFPTYADSDAVDLTAQYNTAVANIDSELHQLSIAPARKRKPGVVVIGDSWSDPNNGETWKAEFQKRFDCTLYNYAKTSARAFVDTAPGATSFTNQLAKATSELDPDDVDYVLIVGGVNDLNKPLSTAGSGYDTLTKYLTGLRALADNACMQFGGARAYVILNAYNSTYGDNNPYSTQYLTNMFSGYSVACSVGRYIYLDLLLYLCTNPIAFDSSNYHLTQAGYNEMGQIIASLLKGNRFNVSVMPSTTPLTEDIGIGLIASNGVVQVRYRFASPSKTEASRTYYDGTSSTAYKMNAIFPMYSTGYSAANPTGSIYMQTNAAFDATNALVTAQKTKGLTMNTTLYQ